MHLPSVWAGALAILILSLIIATRLLGDRLYNYPENPDLSSLPPDAAIVCLTGGKFRVEAAYSLFAQGVGDKLFIVGAGKRSTAMGLAKAHAPGAPISDARFSEIQVETESRNTIENAFAVSRYLQQNPSVRNVVLITSSYHMRRAQLMLEHQVHQDITVIPYTPPNESIHRGNWWHSWLGIEVTVVEYLKYAAAYLVVPQLGNF